MTANQVFCFEEVFVGCMEVCHLELELSGYNEEVTASQVLLVAI